MAGSESETRVHSLSRVDCLQALLLGALSLALYAATACPSLYVGDSAEIAGAAATFGVPHPPGYPVFTLLTGLLLRVLPLADEAYRANLVVGFYGACAISLLALLVRRLGLARSAAWFAPLCLATGQTFWSQCTAAEVYSFDVLLFLASLHGGLSVARAPEAKRAWLAAGVVFGAWLGHRALNFAFAPSLLAFLLASAGLRALLPHGRRWLDGAVAAGVGFGLPLLYLVFASRADPVIDVGDPQSFARLWDVMRGAPYQRHLEDGSLARTGYRLGLFVTGGVNTTELGLGFYAALFALVLALRKRLSGRGKVLALASVAVIDLAFASQYSVLDIQVFFLPAWVACSVLAAFGWDRAVKLVGASPDRVAAQCLGVLLGLVALPQNLRTNDLSEHRLTRIFADELLGSLPPDAILFVNGDTSIHCAWFLQGVEHVREDVTIVSLGHILPWHLEQLAVRHPRVEWPAIARASSATNYARALLLANVESRPVLISPAVDATEITRPDGGRAFELFPRGLARQVYFTGQALDLRELVRGNLELFERIRVRRAAAGVETWHEPDMDSRSTLLQFALCLHFTAQRARQGGWKDLELQALEACLEYDPDVHEQAIHDDVLRGLGFRTPLHRFGASAQARILELRAETAKQSDGD